MKVLVLTDHRGHSEHNSLYAILRQMVDHDQCELVDVVSRGVDDNDSFFENVDRPFWAKSIDSFFSFDPSGRQFLEGTEEKTLSDFDLLFLRLPRPVSDEFLLNLERRFGKNNIINRPSGIIATSNKKFLLECREVCPPIQFCQTVEEVEKFHSNFPIVLKPLREYGGKGLLKIENGLVDDGQDQISWEEYVPRIEDELRQSGYLAMKYLKNVSQGDKRIIVVGGHIMASSLRLPKEGSWLCNIAQGGKSVRSKIEEEEEEIIRFISGKMDENGILIYGLDTLVDDQGKRVLSEINTLSIGGFPQAEEQTGEPIIQKTLDLFFNYANLGQF